MTSVEGSGPGHGAGNPFPFLAVAHVWDTQPDVLTIETEVVKAVDRFIDSYLSAARPGNGRKRTGELLSGTGKVCVIEGDYGTGKTHLAGEILNRVEAARASGGVDTRSFYRAAPGGSFLILYTELMEHDITRDEVLARVREMYADIVADALRDRPYTEDLVARLEQDDADPQLVIARYGLKEGALREELRRRLSQVTRDETFSRALMLMLQPELRPLAWGWFTGGTPDAVLVERGITKPIQTDARALEALGVVARLYGERNRRFVLIIDEVERIAAAWDRVRADSGAFQKLTEVFHAAGALLVVCGLSDVFEMLPDRSRFDAIVHPSPLTAAEVRWYIERIQERASGTRELAPFSQESVDYIVYLTDGVARDVLRICYYAFEEALETGREITPASIRLVARYRMPNNDVERVRSDIAELLIEQGWLAERHRVLGDGPDAVADFWIPFGEEGGGCTVLVSDSVLDDEQARRIVDRVTAIRSAGAGQVVVVVIGGYLTAGQRPVLSDALGAGSLIVYNVRAFGRELVAAIGAARDRIVGVTPGAGRDRAAEEEFRLLREEFSRVVRQQARTLHAMQEMAVRTEDRLDGLERSVAAIPLGPGETAGARQDLPDELATLFGRARQSLDGYGDLRRFVDATIEAAARQPGERFARTHQLREQDTFTRIGVSTFLSDLLDGFRESVRAWLGSLHGERERARGATAAERELLRGICQTYDALYNVTPVYRLEQIPGAAVLATGDQAAVPSRSARREAFRQAFEGLGERVYQAAVQAVGGEPGAGREVLP